MIFTQEYFDKFTSLITLVTKVQIEWLQGSVFLHFVRIYIGRVIVLKRRHTYNIPLIM